MKYSLRNWIIHPTNLHGNPWTSLTESCWLTNQPMDRVRFTSLVESILVKLRICNTPPSWILYQQFSQNTSGYWTQLVHLPLRECFVSHGALGPPPLLWRGLWFHVLSVNCLGDCLCLWVHFLSLCLEWHCGEKRQIEFSSHRGGLWCKLQENQLHV